MISERISGQVKQRKKLFILIICFFFLTGCAPRGFHRTPIKKWEILEFPSMGISFELPQKTSNIATDYYLQSYADEIYLKATGTKSIDVYMHPIWFGTWFEEPFYALQFEFVHIPWGKYKKLQEDKFRPVCRLGYLPNCYKFVPGIWKKMIDGSFANASGKYLLFRHDVRSSNKYVIIARAELLTNLDEYPPEQQAEDIPAIERILNSVKLIPIKNKVVE